MITDDFLVEKLRDIFNENLFNLEGYSIPKFASKEEEAGNLVIDIDKFRSKQLEQRVLYPTTDNFKFALEKSEFLKNIRFIEEFPIVILNRDLWESLNSTLSTKYKSCLFIDFFYPQYNLIVELDGRSYHSNNSDTNLKIEQETKDNMRDAYCKIELGANIIRLKSFGKHQPANDKEIKELENLIKQLQTNNVKSYNSDLYYNYLLNNWKNNYKDELNLINKIEEKYSSSLYSGNKSSVTIHCNNNRLLADLKYQHNIKWIFKLLFNKLIKIQSWNK